MNECEHFMENIGGRKKGGFAWHCAGFWRNEKMHWKLTTTPAAGERRTAFWGIIVAKGGRFSV